jgi:phosphoribosylglycinamide formyltransferase-1
MSGSAHKKRLAILISGRGSNMRSLLDAVYTPLAPVPVTAAEVVAVISNRADAAGLGIAQQFGVATIIHPSQGVARDAYDAELHRILTDLRVDLVCLAGFMRILSEKLVLDWAGKMVNIHPSLLPNYKGLDTHARVLADGGTEHGCTTHFVTPGMDEGPIILQSACPVLPGDTPDTLGERVLALEHQIYPKTVQLFCQDRLRIKNGRVEILDL